jgi:hypothetical protein
MSHLGRWLASPPRAFAADRFGRRSVVHMAASPHVAARWSWTRGTRAGGLCAATSSKEHSDQAALWPTRVMPSPTCRSGLHARLGACDEHLVPLGRWSRATGECMDGFSIADCIGLAVPRGARARRRARSHRRPRRPLRGADRGGQPPLGPGLDPGTLAGGQDRLCAGGYVESRAVVPVEPRVSAPLPLHGSCLRDSSCLLWEGETCVARGSQHGHRRVTLEAVVCEAVCSGCRCDMWPGKFCPDRDVDYDAAEIKNRPGSAFMTGAFRGMPEASSLPWPRRVRRLGPLPESSRLTLVVWAATGGHDRGRSARGALARRPRQRGDLAGQHCAARSDACSR